VIPITAPSDLGLATPNLQIPLRLPRGGSHNALRPRTMAYLQVLAAEDPSAATILPIGHTPRRPLSALIATVDCGRMTRYAEVIRRRTLDRFGGFRPTRREVVQKSASRRSPRSPLHVDSSVATRAFLGTNHDCGNRVCLCGRAQPLQWLRIRRVVALAPLVRITW
jgi:hypothetical protein